MTALKNVEYTRLERILPPRDRREIERGEHALALSGHVTPKKNDSLVEIEVAFRACKRVGVFD